MAEPFLPEYVRNVVHTMSQKNKRFFNAESRNCPRIAEGYIEGTLCLHLHMGVVASRGDPVLKHYCAVFERAAIGFHEGFKLQVPHVRELNLRVAGDVLSEVHFPVLVPVRETVEDEEGVSLVPSIVRLKPLEDCDIVGVHTSSHPLPPLKRLFAGIGGKWIIRKDREPRVTVGFVSVCVDELPCEVVKGRTEVVADFSDNDAPFDRRVVSNPHIHDIIVRLTVEVFPEFIRATPQESLHGTIKGLHVLVCPV